MTIQTKKTNLSFDRLYIPESIIQSFLSNEGISIKTNRSNFCMNSIFVADDKYKLWISRNKNGIWQCFKTGHKGDFINLVKEIKGFSSYKDAKKYVIKEFFFKNKSNIMPLVFSTVAEETKTSLFFPESFEPLIQQEEYINYLKSRWIDPSSLKLFVNEKDKRIVFPVYESGSLIFYTARSVDPNEKIRWKNASASGKTPIYGLENAGKTLYVFEGIFDALSVPSGIAIFGANNTGDAVVKKLLTTNPYRVYIVMDNDPAGRRSAISLCEKLYKKISTYIFDWNCTEAKDANELLVALGGDKQKLEDTIKQYSESYDLSYKIKNAEELNNLSL
jgi:DNA primase